MSIHKDTEVVACYRGTAGCVVTVGHTTEYCTDGTKENGHMRRLAPKQTKATEGLSYEPCGVTDEGEPNLPCVLIKNHDEDTMHVDRFGGRWCE